MIKMLRLWILFVLISTMDQEEQRQEDTLEPVVYLDALDAVIHLLSTALVQWARIVKVDPPENVLIVNPEVKVRFEHKCKAPVAVDANLNESCSDDDRDTDDVDEEVEELQKRLQKLQIPENNARKRVMVADLRRQLEEKEKSIVALEESIHLVGPSRAINGREIREREIRDCTCGSIQDSSGSENFCYRSDSSPEVSLKFFRYWNPRESLQREL